MKRSSVFYAARGRENPSRPRTAKRFNPADAAGLAIVSKSPFDARVGGSRAQ